MQRHSRADASHQRVTRTTCRSAVSPDVDSSFATAGPGYFALPPRAGALGCMLTNAASRLLYDRNLDRILRARLYKIDETAPVRLSRHLLDRICLYRKYSLEHYEETFHINVRKIGADQL